MRRRRRQLVIRLVGRAALVLVLLDVTLYFALLRPMQNTTASEQQRFAAFSIDDIDVKSLSGE